VGILVGIPMAAEKVLPGEAWLGVLGIIPLAAGIIATIGWYWERKSWTAPLVATAGGLVVVGILALGASRADLQRFDQQMVVSWAKTSTKEAPLAAYRVLEPSWVYYSHQAIPELLGEPAAAARLLEEHPGMALVTKEQLVPAIRRELAGELEIAQSAPHFLRSERLVILRLGRPAGAARTAEAVQGKKTSH
jgi:hypothetical protein